MEGFFRFGKLCVLVLFLTPGLSLGSAEGQDARTAELNRLATQADQGFLLSELVRFQPPERLRELAGFIAENEGKQAVGEFLQQGSVPFFLHGANFGAETGKPLLPPEVIAAVDDLKIRLVQLSR